MALVATAGNGRRFGRDLLDWGHRRCPSARFSTRPGRRIDSAARAPAGRNPMKTTLLIVVSALAAGCGGKTLDIGGTSSDWPGGPRPDLAVDGGPGVLLAHQRNARN